MKINIENLKKYIVENKQNSTICGALLSAGITHLEYTVILYDGAETNEEKLLVYHIENLRTYLLGIIEKRLIWDKNPKNVDLLVYKTLSGIELDDKSNKKNSKNSNKFVFANESEINLKKIS